MSSSGTTIAPGLEIRHLSWKDDSFRMVDWYDITTGNQITFSNGTVTTNGITGDFSINPFNLPSPVITNGDEVFIPGNTHSGGYTIQKEFGTEATVIPIPFAAIQSIRLRAKTVAPSSTAIIVIALLNASFSIIGSVTATVTTSIYSHFTIPIIVSSNVGGIQITSIENCMIDYVAIANCDFLNQGGMSLNVSIPKKTDPQTIPNQRDIIQQLGIGSRSKAVTIPKVSTSVYRWLENLMSKSTPIEVVSPTEQATGYLSDMSRHSEAGWVGTPIATADALCALPLTSQQLYDVSFSLVKADNEQNIDQTIPNCPGCSTPTPPGPPSPPSPTTGGSIVGSGIYNGIQVNGNGQQTSFFAAGLIWVFFIDTSTGYLCYKTTTLSSSPVWSTEQVVVFTSISNQYYDIWWDGTYMYYVYEHAGYFFRRGIPQSGGTISWSAAEQSTISTGGAPQVIADTSLFPWILGYESSIGKSSTSNGTWVTQAGFPVNALIFSTSMIPMTAGKIAVLGCSTARLVVWNGSSFLTPASISGTTPTGTSPNTAVALGDTIYWAFPTGSGVYFAIYDYSTNSFPNPSVLVDSAGTEAVGVSTDGTNVYLFYTTGPALAPTALAYKVWNGSSLSSSVVVCPLTAGYSLYYDQISVWPNPSGSIIGIALMVFNGSSGTNNFTWIVI